MAYDVIIVGAGLAGLSAALVLGRCCRKLLVFDTNSPRNHASRALHGYLTQDGVSPWILRQRGRADVAKYPNVEVRETKVTRARRANGGFEVTAEGGAVERSRLLLLATGRVDPLPSIPGFHEFYGRGVHHCPYCDGWEHRGKKLAVVGSGRQARDLAAELLTWSERITICSNGKPAGREIKSAGFEIITDTISEVRGSEAGVESVHFKGRGPMMCDALFFCTDCPQRSSLPLQLGCTFDEDDSVLCEANAAKGVGGLYIAGNVRGGVHLAITAAAEGAEAAIAMNEALLESAGAF